MIDYDIHLGALVRATVVNNTDVLRSCIRIASFSGESGCVSRLLWTSLDRLQAHIFNSEPQSAPHAWIGTYAVLDQRFRALMSSVGIVRRNAVGYVPLVLQHLMDTDTNDCV